MQDTTDNYGQDRRIPCVSVERVVERVIDTLPQEELLRAVEKLNDRIARDPEDPPSLIARGLLHSMPGDDRRAAEDSVRLWPLNPETPRLATTGHWLAPHWGAPAGEGGLRRHHHLNPDDAIAHYNRGACLAKLGGLGRAMEDFDAANLNSADPISHFNRACTRAELGACGRR